MKIPKSKIEGQHDTMAKRKKGQIKSNQIKYILFQLWGPRGANKNYTYSKITHINSQEGKSWWLIEHDIQTCYKYIKYII